MKKFLMLILAAGMAFMANAQAEVKMTNPNGAAIDTFINTTAEGPSARIPGQVKTISFAMELTSNTGTVAGKIYLQGANRAGKWTFPYLDSVTLAPGTNNWQLTAVDPKFQLYRLWVVPTGTQNTSYVSYYYVRKL